MQALLEHLSMQIASYSLGTVVLVTFLESLALVGLVLPGTIIMAGLGTLIGSGEVNFWHAWIAGIIGCLLGDWISFLLGWYFKKTLLHWSFIKKNKTILDKTQHALYQHSMLTILIGRFIGPMRPLVPIIAGMLDLPITKFLLPNIIGCVFWPPFYFLPGILAGAAINIPLDRQNNHFKWILLITILLLWLAIWLYYRQWRNNSNHGLARLLPRSYLFWLAPIILGISVILLIQNPMMQVYREILLKVVC